MTSDTSPWPVSPLRARMIEEMSVRGFRRIRAATMCDGPSLRGLYRPVA